MKKVEIISEGRCTHVIINGVDIAQGCKEITFHHKASKEPELTLKYWKPEREAEINKII